MHGPGPRTATNALGWEPIYPSPMPIIDDVCKTLPGGRRSWRIARNRALALWEQAGLAFTVTEGTGVPYTGEQPWLVGAAAAPYITPGSIRLLPYGLAGKPSFGFYQDIWAEGQIAYHGAIAVYAAEIILVPEWLKRYKRRDLIGMIGHEVGHCLGLWHRDRYIMGGGNIPDEHDLISLRDYYLS